MVERGWPGLLSALTFLLSTNLSDDLFAETLGAFQNILNVAGVLGLTTPRDAFLASLSKFAIPPGVVSSVDAYVEPAVPKTATMSDAFGFSSSNTTMPSLSERNMACLKSIVYTASYLSGSLGSKWFDILEVFQNADYVMTMRGLRPLGTSKRNAQTVPPTSSFGRPGSRTVSGSISGPSGGGDALLQTSRHPLLTDLDIETIQSAITRLLDGTRNFDDNAFREFVSAMCRLSREMIYMQAARSPGMRPSDSMDDLGSPTLASTSMSPSSSLMAPFAGANIKAGRRVSGMGMPKAAVSRRLFSPLDAVKLTRHSRAESGRLLHWKAGTGVASKHPPPAVP